MLSFFIVFFTLLFQEFSSGKRSFSNAVTSDITYQV